MRLTRWTWAAAGGLAGLLALPWGVGGAEATPSCAYVEATGIASITLNLPPGESATISRSGDAIDLNGSPCGSATISNTVRIAVTGTTGGDVVTINLSGGPFFDPATSAAIKFGLDLGSGADRLEIVGSAGADNVRFGSDGINPDVGAATRADVTFAHVEAFAVSAGGGEDIVSGAGGAGTGAVFPWPIDGIDGGPGGDLLIGGAGNDRLVGGPGEDALNGGDGRDSADYFEAPGPVTANLATGTAADGTGATDRLTSIENLIGSGYGGTLIGDENANGLVGRAPSEILEGAGGNDMLQGGGTIDGGGGTNTYRCFGSEDVSVDLAAGTASGCGSATLTNIQNAAATTTCDEDVGCPVKLVGTAAANVLQIVGGCNCTDSLSGGDGADTLRGGAHTFLTDVLHGGPGNDTLFGRAGNDTLFGGLGSDQLFAGHGRDRLYGEDGNDQLDGGLGIDACSGGPGIDVLLRCE